MLTRILSIGVVDGHPVVLEGIASAFRREPGYVVAGTGSSADDMLEIADKFAVDIMVVDIDVEGDVFQALDEARRRFPAMRIVIFTGSTRSEHAIRALNAGAKAYVLKDSPLPDLIEAVDFARQGAVYITPSFAGRVIGSLQSVNVQRHAPRVSRLSVREEQIMRLLLCGRQNREIASSLGLSERTVKGYMTNLMMKLGARNRLEVVIAAQKLEGARSPA